MREPDSFMRHDERGGVKGGRTEARGKRERKWMGWEGTKRQEWEEGDKGDLRNQTCNQGNLPPFRTAPSRLHSQEILAIHSSPHKTTASLTSQWSIGLHHLKNNRTEAFPPTFRPTHFYKYLLPSQLEREIGGEGAGEGGKRFLSQKGGKFFVLIPLSTLIPSTPFVPATFPIHFCLHHASFQGHYNRWVGFPFYGITLILLLNCITSK